MQRFPVSISTPLSFIFCILCFVAHCKGGRGAGPAGGREPQFLVQPSDTGVVLGGTAYLYCVVSRTDGEVQWTRNSFALGVDRSLPGFPRYSMVGNITAASNCGQGCITGEYTLRIDNVQLNDEAVYQCQVGATVTWPSGLRSRTATLQVLVAPSAPVIINGPVVEARDGSTVNFTCTVAGGHPKPNVTWVSVWGSTVGLTTARAVQWADGKRWNVTSVLTLTATREDTGQSYECRATNAALDSGQWLIASVQLQVLHAPVLSMNIQPANGLRERDTAYFTCFAVANPVDVTWRWYLGSQLLPNQTTQTYVVKSLTRSLNGHILTCEAQNSIGSTFFDSTLSVQYAPTFEAGVTYITARPGEGVTMSCDADSNPPPSIIWYRPDTGKIIGNSQDLMVVSMKPSDFGLYICIATTLSFPAASHHTYVFEPAIPTYVSNATQETCIGCVGQVTCEIYGYPRPNVTAWTKNGNIITSNSRYREIHEVIPTGLRLTLMIGGVQEADLGVYNCSATNVYGSSYHLITLHSSALIPLDAIAIGSSVGIVLVLAIITVSVCIWSRRGRRKDIILVDPSASIHSLHGLEMSQSQQPLVPKDDSVTDGTNAWKRNVYGPMDLLTSDSRSTLLLDTCGHGHHHAGGLHQCSCRASIAGIGGGGDGGIDAGMEAGSDRSSVIDNLLELTSAGSHDGGGDVSSLAMAYNVQRSTLKQYVRVKQRHGSNDASSSTSGSHHSRSLSPASSNDEAEGTGNSSNSGRMGAVVPPGPNGLMASIDERESDEESGVYYIEQERRMQASTPDFDGGNTRFAFPGAGVRRSSGGGIAAPQPPVSVTSPYVATNPHQRRAMTPLILQATPAMNMNNTPGRIPLPSLWRDSVGDEYVNGGVSVVQPMNNGYKADVMAYRPASVAGNRINRSDDSPSPALSGTAYKQGILSRSKTYQPRSHNVPRSVTFRLPETANSTLQRSSAMSASESCLATDSDAQFLRPALDSTPLATEV